MDEYHWLTSHGCIFVIGCNLLGSMWDGVSMGLGIMFGFVSSQLGYAGTLRSYHICANSYLLPNLASFDVSFIKV